ncbi:hypothetical protein WL29_23065 [Burkholderia ubonensis]|uniref:Uncharacterized protein n=2 Tax=Burkholderia ubonensis TaxID=101571 RepID=A0A106QC40_9BURK|nr:hypothetical protein WL29_23065 [Burkholderia ubonensis]
MPGSAAPQLSMDTPSGKPSFFTPLRVYLIFIAAVLLLASSPFTVGPAVASLTALALRGHDAVTLWAASSPLKSWLTAGGLGLILTSICAGWMMYDEAVGKRKALCVTMSVSLLVCLVVLEYLFICLPGYEQLFDAFGAAGGTPAWLNGVATFVVVAMANAFHVALAVLVFGSMAAAGSGY